MSSRLMTNMARLEKAAFELPEVERVDIEAWGDEATFRVRGKNFVFCDQQATQLSVKLTKEEATAAAAGEAWVEPTGYGLGRHGWVTVTIDARVDEDRWQLVREWVITSYTLVAPKRLARMVLAAEGAEPPENG